MIRQLLFFFLSYVCVSLVLGERTSVQNDGKKNGLKKVYYSQIN